MHGIHEWVATSATSNSLPTSPCLPRVAGRGSRLILPRLCSSLRTSTISLPSPISVLGGKEEAWSSGIDETTTSISSFQDFLPLFKRRGARIVARLGCNYARPDSPTAKLYATTSLYLRLLSAHKRGVFVCATITLV